MKTKNELFNWHHVPIGRPMLSLLRSGRGVFPSSHSRSHTDSHSRLLWLVLLVFVLFSSNQSTNAKEATLWWGAEYVTMDYNRPCIELSLCLGDDKGDYSYFSDKNLFYVYLDNTLICSSTELDMRMGTSALVKLRNSGWNRSYTNPTTGVYIKAHNPTYHDSEPWISLMIVPSYSYMGQNHNVKVTGKYYCNDNNRGIVTLTAPGYNDKMAVPDMSLTRSNGKINYSGSLSNANYTDYSWGLTLFTDKPGKTQNLSPTATNCLGGGTQHATSGASTMSVSFDADNYKGYTFYPRMSISRNDVFGGSIRPTFFKDYEKVNIPGYPRAASVSFDPKKWTKTIIISWSSEVYDQNNVDTNGKWYIYRKNLSDNTIALIGSDINYNSRTYTDDSESLDYSVPYTYYVCFVPNGWTANDWTDVEGLYASANIMLKREYQFNSFSVEGRPDNIAVNWNVESFGDASNNNTYDVVLQRSVNNNTDWTDIYTQTINNKDTKTGSYTDGDVSNPCTEYFYRLKVLAQDTTFYSNEMSEHISGVSKVINIAASRGTYTGRVRVQWEAEQYGTEVTYYTVRRRLLGSGEDKWVTLHSTNGTAVSYNYQDDTAQPGDYYEYQVISETKCQTSSGNVKNSVSTDGFCQARGVVSGRISYGTGTAVEGAQVVLTRSDDSGSNVQSFYSLRLQGTGDGVDWSIPNEMPNYTVQFFLRPELDETRTANTVLLEESGSSTPLLQLSSYDATNERYQLILKGSNSGVYVKPSEFTLITLRYNGSDYTLSTFDQHRDITAYSKTGQKLSAENLHFGYTTDTSKPQFQGYLDEIRIFSRSLSDDEIIRNADHTLAGNEDGLVAYIPLDEGIQALRKAYDYSKMGGAANENHGDLTGGTFSTTIPLSNQLGLLGYSDDKGNYVVRGVPFNGEGTNYSVTPMMNNHEFSPEEQSRYVSVQSLVHSGVDFTDISSFEVSGVIRYVGTNIPVDSVQLYIDDRLATRNNEAVVTDEEGKFIIDVPIGKHYISAVRDGHTFLKGRIPDDPSGLNQTVYEFVKKESGWQFWDNTLVTVAGRVVGGAVEGEKPLGFADSDEYRSKNTIGQAEITLEIPDTHYMLNAYEETNNLVSLGFRPVTDDTPLTYPIGVKATGTGYRTGGTDEDNAKRVVIKTDAATGDFAVLLPPLDYKVVSVKMVNAQADQAYKFSSDQLPRIDASDAKTVLQDSIPTEDGGYRYFDYVAAMKLTKHTDPVLSVRQMKRNKKDVLPEGVFGDETSSYTIPTTGKKQTVDLYTVNGNNVTYNFGYPIFGQAGKYTFELEGYESYTNYDEGLDDDERITKVPLRNTVITISNALSDTQKVYAAAPETGENAGQVADLQENQLQLDENGMATYTWNAGLPNIQPPYTRRLNMTYNNGAGDYSWQGLDGVIFGDLPDGTNFTTKGPSKVEMVLHDPYGDSSFATWESGTVTVQSRDTLWSDHKEEVFATNIHLGPKLEIDKGFLVSTQTEIEVIADFKGGFTKSTERDSIYSHTTTIEINQAVSTSADPDMVGADADIYIGQGTNLLFGGARSVGLMADVNEQPQIMVDNVITMGQQFETNFYYTQYEIENKVIPDLKRLRNELLKQVADIATATNESDSTIYVTQLDKDDENFGEPGTYKMLAKKAGLDMVGYYNDEIQSWKNQIAASEKYKLDRFQKASDKEKENVSFGGGVDITKSESTSTSFSREDTYTHMYYVDFGVDLGGTYNGIGADISYESHTNTHANGAETKFDEETATTTFSYTLSDSGADDSFSMNIYKASGNHGPVFRTVGGQSSCPYEGQEVTKYYKKGTELSAATVQLDQPEIICKNNMLTGIPSGGKAQFELELKNLNGIGVDAYFELVPVDGANPKGAKLSLPTGDIHNGRTILVPAGDKPVKMILTLEQVDIDVTDYENIKLALRSSCQNDETTIHGAIKSEVSLNAHFVPASTPVILTIDKTVVNTQNVNDDIMLKVTGFDRNFSGLQRVDIQYMAPGATTWSLLQGYIPEELPEDGVITLPLDMNSKNWIDGTYKFRARSSATYSGAPVTAESEVLTLVKDVHRPQLFGLASPTDGILNTGDEISLTFNEDIQKELLTDNNFVVSGVLNGADVAHDVALSAQNTERAAYTEASFNLAQKDFSADMWVNVTAAGDIFAHGNGEEKFKLSIDEDNHLVVTIGSESYTSTKTIEKNTWTFLAFNYNYESGSSVLNVRAVTDNATEDLFVNTAVADYAGTGKIMLGQHFTGAIQELALWDNARSVADAQAEMHWTKKPSTPHLIGYWKMDEGSGTEIRDYARSRHMTLPNSTSWYLNNDNKAVTLNGTDALKLNIAECSVLDTEDYAVEMWFKGDKAQNTTASSLLYTNEESVGIGFNNGGMLTLTAGNQTIELSKNNYLDNAWHHLALNVLRNGNATVYVDGNAVKTMSAQIVPSLEGAYLYIGTRDGNQPFIGMVDEIRLWKSSMTGDMLNNLRTQRLVGDESGLVAYYPFETLTRNTSGIISSVSSDQDFSDGAKTAETYSGAAITYNDEAPAMKVKPVATNVLYSYVANERSIVITLNEDVNRLEGSTVNFTVRGVKDTNGNESNAISWSAYVRQNSLLWKGETEATIEKTVGEAATFEATIINESGLSENWTLTGLPTWLTASATSGTLKATMSKNITFTIAESVPIGKYEQTIYLTGNNNIAEPLTLNLNVKGEEPDWMVNVGDYESSMNVIGYVELNGTLMNDENDIVAAFINDECRGVAHLDYKERYDGYFVTMDIYGDESDANQKVTFRFYDASTGTVYPAVEPNLNIKYESLALIGKYNEPVVFSILDKVEQSTNLKSGWNWLSLNVKADNMSAEAVFEKIASDVSVIKSQNSGYLMYEEGEWDGNLETALTNDQMYAVKMLNDRNLYLVGSRVTPGNCPITVYKGWNWIGYYGRQLSSVERALNTMNPEDGDVLKGQKGVSYFDVNEWAGSINMIEPGKGYMLKGVSDDVRIFSYDAVLVAGARAAAQLASRPARRSPVTAFVPVDFRTYSNNAIMAVEVVFNGLPEAGVELGVFAGNECRAAAITNEKGIAYLTIPGDDAATLTFKAAVNGLVVTPAETVEYEADGIYGSPKHPLVIELDNATGVGSLNANINTNGMYDLQGRKVQLNGQDKKLRKGVYIINGKKQVK